jgi:prepilin-type N-terminal cleavage/methylation domain-containing protein
MRNREKAFIPLETGRQGRPSDISNASSLTGFTLVEILVVLSIMAMLLGILVPALAAARRVAYKTACKENLHGCALAFRMYLDDNKNIMPTVTNMPNLHLTENPIPIYTVLGKYLSGHEALKCPADPQATYFREQGSSYEYNVMLANQVIDKTWMARRLGTMEVWMLHDYSGWHGKQNANGTYPTGAYMYLYADTLVADRERNK